MKLHAFPVVALLAALAFTVLLTACGGGDPEDTDEPDGRKTIQPVHWPASAPQPGAQS